MSSTVDTLTGSDESGDLPQLRSDVLQVSRSGDIVPELTAIVHVLDEFAALPELRCIYGFMFGIVEALEEPSEVTLRQFTIGAGDF